MTWLGYLGTSTFNRERHLKTIPMRVQVRLLPGGEDEFLEMEPEANALQLLDRLELSPDAHIILRDGRPLPVDALLADGDELDVVTVISGGSQRGRTF